MDETNTVGHGQSIGGQLDGNISTIKEPGEIEEKKGFLYEISNSKCTVSELKTLVNSIMKSIETDEDLVVAFELHILGNGDLSKEKSTIIEMKSLVTTMLKFLEKGAAATEISFELKIESI